MTKEQKKDRIKKLLEESRNAAVSTATKTDGKSKAKSVASKTETGKKSDKKPAPEAGETDERKKLAKFLSGIAETAEAEKKNKEIEQVKLPGEKTLMRKTREELLALAKQMKVRAAKDAPKKDIVERLLAAKQEQAGEAKGEKPAVKRVRKQLTELERLAAKAPTAPVPAPPDEKESAQSSRFAYSGQRRLKDDEETLVFPKWDGKSYLYLLSRDERYIFATWEISWETRKELLGEQLPEALVLLVYDFGKITDLALDPSITKIEVDEKIDNWFVDTKAPNHVFEAELGFVLDGEFLPIARSNRCATLPDDESDIDLPIFITIDQNLPVIKNLETLGKPRLPGEVANLYDRDFSVTYKPQEKQPLTKQQINEITKAYKKAIEGGLPSSLYPKKPD